MFVKRKERDKEGYSEGMLYFFFYVANVLWVCVYVHVRWFDTVHKHCVIIHLMIRVGFLVTFVIPSFAEQNN